jgi:RNA polymerase sigma-70 factor (ECF subfamily)
MFVESDLQARCRRILLKAAKVSTVNSTAIKPKPSTPATHSDDLVRVGQDRDKAAFARLFAHFAPRVKSYLIGLGSGAELAEELAQESLVTVWRKAHTFDPSKASAATWIFTVARNLRIDVLRKERRPTPDAEDPMWQPNDVIASDELVSLEERQVVIRAALKKLPSDQADVIRMSFFEDKSHGVIAEELKLPLGTVKSRLRLAFKRLKAQVGETLL